MNIENRTLTEKILITFWDYLTDCECGWIIMIKKNIDGLKISDALNQNVVEKDSKVPKWLTKFFNEWKIVRENNKSYQISWIVEWIKCTLIYNNSGVIDLIKG